MSTHYNLADTIYAKAEVRPFSPSHPPTHPPTHLPIYRWPATGACACGWGRM